MSKVLHRDHTYCGCHAPLVSLFLVRLESSSSAMRLVMSDTVPFPESVIDPPSPIGARSSYGRIEASPLT